MSFLRPIFLFVCLSLLAPSAHAATNIDRHAAVIFAYTAIGHDDEPDASVTMDQFAQHIDELTSGPYTIKSLPDIIAAFEKKRTLPDRTIALTFNGGDKSFLKVAPLLEKNKLPYTLFLATDRINSGKPDYLSWDDLQKLNKTGLASFGIHPASYAHLTGKDPAEIRRQINSSLSEIRDELGVTPTLFAYPDGEYDETYYGIAKSLGLRAAFGLQSGTAFINADRFALPRFLMTERYADMDRFTMAANALPLPASDISPQNPHLPSRTPAIGFTMPDDYESKLQSLNCFASGGEKTDIQILGTRVELRLKSPFREDAPRVDCTLSVPSTNDEPARTRWLGFLYTMSD